MFLRIGNKTRPFNEARCSIRYQPVYDAKKRAIAFDETWDISGRIVLQTNATQTRMTQAIALLRTDFQQERPNLIFIEDDGVTQSAFKLLANECIDGPRMDVSGFPNDGADVYATGMAYNVTAIARRPVSGSGSNPILEFREQIANPSGGMELGFVGGAINDPELQVFRQNAPYLYTQSGSAVGMYGHITAPGPLWPQFQLRRNAPVYASARVIGFVNTEFETSWQYEFGSPYPLIGLPHEI